MRITTPFTLTEERYPDSLLQVIRKTGSGSSTTAETLNESEFTITGKNIEINENKRTGAFEVTYIPLDSVKKYFGNENVTQLKENPIGSFLIQAVRDPIGTFMTENRYYIGTELAYNLDSKKAVLAWWSFSKKVLASLTLLTE